MEFIELKLRPGIENIKNLTNSYHKFNQLLDALKQWKLTEKVSLTINQTIGQLNAFTGPDKAWCKQVRKAHWGVMRMLEKELKLVQKHHYRKTWMAIGMSFGVPFGVAFGLSAKNMAFIGVGIPIGMANHYISMTSV